MNSGSFSPSRSRTYAFFQSGRRPAKRPCRFNLPRIDVVRTVGHLRAEQLSRRRCRICTLFASAATCSTSVRPSSRRIVVFSVMSGRRITSGQLHASTSCSLSTAARVAITTLRVHHVARRHAAARHQPHVGDVPDRQRELRVGRHVDDQRLAARAEPLEQRRRGLGLDLARGQRVDDGHVAVLQLLRTAPRAARRARPSSAADSRSCAAAGRRPCRPCATADSESRRRARGRCPSAATASCRCR